MPRAKTVTVEELEKETQLPTDALPCGHVNKQHYNTAGKLEDLVCDLDEGHAGDHRAAYKTNAPDYVYGEKGQVVKVNYIVNEAVTRWGDMAGTPAAEIVEEPILQMNMHQRDMVMRILQENPARSVKEAVARAKMTKEWGAISV